ncbi:type II toxin-antitoxin system VapC family toxin [Gordonia sp. CPCC 205515]|uniref:type II toxin-antitoxin system VapC family toxin n=1 Tax=Gordonia sp. CPCC 205515 TaxID=3140791 RepID=UPI003AF3D86C
MPDVNILVGAFRGEDPRHPQLYSWLESVLGADEPLALTPAVVSGYVRVVTNPRIFADPTPVPTALGHIDVLRENASVLDVAPGRRHWAIFSALCRESDARGDLVADAHHAATAIEHGATWVTLDRDFARFERLTWRLPE